MPFAIAAAGPTVRAATAGRLSSGRECSARAGSSRPQVVRFGGRLEASRPSAVAALSKKDLVKK
eukprot:scaffold667386_cov93-Prasinocladus_malaysianus.AAC.1